MASLLGYFEVILAIFCFIFLSRSRDNNGLPWNWPFFGMLPGLLLHVRWVHDQCVNILGLAGGTFLLKGPWFTNMDMLATADPANIHYIMSANFANFPKGPQFRKIFDFLGDGIFNSDDDLWKHQRKIARLQVGHHRFHRYLVKTTEDKVAKGLVPVLEHAADRVESDLTITKLKDKRQKLGKAKVWWCMFYRGQVVDLQDVFQRFTFDTTCILVTGYDPGCLSTELPDVPFSRAMDEAEEAVFHRHIVPEAIWKFQRWLGVGAEKKLTEATKTLNHVVDKYISIKRGELGKEAKLDEEQEGVDLLTSYLKEEELSGGLKADDKFLRDTILNFMIAGRDTTSSALTWFLWLVSTHPDVETKIRKEIEDVVTEESKTCRVFRVVEVGKLVYLHAALCETLRLYPAVPFQHKEPVKPDTLPSGHRVHPKMKILFSLYAMGRMKFIWGEDCAEFKPERWITERGTVKHEPAYKFLAFNAGPRTCLGKEVAFTQMKTVAATILHNYNVRLVEGHPVAPNVSIILYMKHGFKVNVSKRWT